MKQFLKEYYINILPKDSGVPVRIWIDTGQDYLKGGHSYRLKFENNGELIPMLLPSLEIPTRFLNSRKIKYEIVKQVRLFAEKNIEILMLAKDGIDTKTLKDNLKSVNDETIEIIGNDEDNYTVTGLERQGFRLVKHNSNGKFNFIDKGNNLVSDCWFDKTDGGFIKMGDSLFAFILNDGKWYKLFSDGKIEEINNF